jgi:hypothetical protein
MAYASDIVSATGEVQTSRIVLKTEWDPCLMAVSIQTQHNRLYSSHGLILRNITHSAEVMRKITETLGRDRWSQGWNLRNAKARLLYEPRHKKPRTQNLNKEQEILGRTNRLLSFNMTQTAQKTEKLGEGGHRQQCDLINLLTKTGGGGDTETNRQQGDVISLKKIGGINRKMGTHRRIRRQHGHLHKPSFYFFQNNKSRL